MIKFTFVFAALAIIQGATCIPTSNSDDLSGDGIVGSALGGVGNALGVVGSALAAAEGAAGAIANSVEGLLGRSESPEAAYTWASPRA